MRVHGCPVGTLARAARVTDWMRRLAGIVGERVGKIMTIQLHNGKELAYSDVTRVEKDRYQVKIYRERELLAVIDRGDIKNVCTEES